LTSTFFRRSERVPRSWNPSLPSSRCQCCWFSCSCSGAGTSSEGDGPRLTASSFWSALLSWRFALLCLLQSRCNANLCSCQASLKFTVDRDCWFTATPLFETSFVLKNSMFPSPLSKAKWRYSIVYWRVFESSLFRLICLVHGGTVLHFRCILLY